MIFFVCIFKSLRIQSHKGSPISEIVSNRNPADLVVEQLFISAKYIRVLVNMLSDDFKGLGVDMDT